MTTHRPAGVVREWLASGELKPTDPDSRVEVLADLYGYFDVSWRHEALTALRIIRHEATTGDPF